MFTLTHVHRKHTHTHNFVRSQPTHSPLPKKDSAIHWLWPKMTVWSQLRMNSDRLNKCIASWETKTFMKHSSETQVKPSLLSLPTASYSNEEYGSLLEYTNNTKQRSIWSPLTYTCNAYQITNKSPPFCPKLSDSSRSHSLLSTAIQLSL